MRGWRIIPDRAGYDEVTLTKLGQAVTIGRHYCDIAIPNEHTSVSRTHAVVKVVGRAPETPSLATLALLSMLPGRAGVSRRAVLATVTQRSPGTASQVEPTAPWRIVVVDTSKRGVYVDGERIKLDPDSGIWQRQLHVGQTFSLSLIDDGVPSFTVGLIGAVAAPQPPASEAGDETATAPSAEEAVAKRRRGDGAEETAAAVAEALAPSAAEQLQPTTAAEAVAAAAAEGLTLVRANNASGFRYVLQLGNRHRAQLRFNGERRYLGSFHTPEQAALRVARWLRDRASEDEPRWLMRRLCMEHTRERRWRRKRRRLRASHCRAAGRRRRESRRCPRRMRRREPRRREPR